MAGSPVFHTLFSAATQYDRGVTLQPARASNHSSKHRVPLYTPLDHPMRPTAPLQRQLEGWRVESEVGLLAVGNLTAKDMYFRHAPVEARFFSQFAVDCTADARRIPPPGHHCDHEPKFSCGRIGSRHGPATGEMPSCHVWSIGSAGETCFEEYVHELAPHCEIHSFDPTLPPAAEQHMQRLQAGGVLQYHRIGLSDRRGRFSIKRYRDKTSSIECNSQDIFLNTTKYSADVSHAAQVPSPTHVGRALAAPASNLLIAQ